MSDISAIGNNLAKRLGDWRVWSVHLLANPLLFGLFVGWLFIPESHAWQLGFSFLGVTLLAAAALLLEAGTLSYFAADEPAGLTSLGHAYARALRNFGAVLVCAAIACFGWWLAGRLQIYQETLPAYLRSEMPAALRRHVTRAEIGRVYGAVIFIVRWILCPGLLLPFVTAGARFGFRGFPRTIVATWRAISSGFYWFVFSLLALAGLFFTGLLVSWRPQGHDATVARESVSMTFRLSTAYLVGLAAWLGISALLGSCLESAAEIRRQPVG